MGFIKELAAKAYANYTHSQSKLWKFRAAEVQEKWLLDHCMRAANTAFGKDHGLGKVQSIKDYQKAVPVRGYEELRPYIDRMVGGESDVLWPGRPLYYAKTSGTTSGTKYIPISKESMPFHIQSAKEALLLYIYYTGKADYVSGKMIFLQGSPSMTETKGVKTGRLSGIVAHYVPSYLQKNRLPSWETNCIEDWETKLTQIVEETKGQDMRLIGGIPPWVQMYYEYLLKATGKKSIQELFPKLRLFVTGGVNYEPYRGAIDSLIGKSIDIIETYPASEGFIAYNDSSGEDGLLLLANHGIFYEFIPLSEYGKENAPRLTLSEVKIGVNYAILMTTNAGLWSYSIGDTVEFVSLNPFRLKVSGRVAHYISAFGEHVIGSEVEYAIEKVCKYTQTSVVEFTVAPQVNPESGLPYHEWFIAFDQPSVDIDLFATLLDEALCEKNSYYKDLIVGKILRPAVVREMERDSFQDYMRSIGKLGGQNKLPRLSNDRKIADALFASIEKK
jgi:hypothetical protein